MLNLAGYEETDQLYAGTRTLVYRAIQKSDKQPVIIKVLRNPHPNFNELVQFRNQYTIAKNLEHPGIVQPLALEPYGNGYALIMPDEGAISLPDYWQGCSDSLSEFLNIAIQLADALHYLTGERIVHKDIKPGNILICPETQQVKLIDFSISSLLPKEQQQLLNPNVLEGTLAYISPEQTGRMNRGIDYRTDFYSLGVTFYELLAGELPFQSEDPMELVHCHIAKTPILPIARHPKPDTRHPTPDTLLEIVLKLMAKNAEDRYQSALGLKHDLDQCLQQLETTGEITPFEIGQRDICSRFTIPEKLYGREKEVAQLLTAFERVIQGETDAGRLGDGEKKSNSELMLVAGFSGIGKTAVINEVHKPIVKQRGYFIKGKFDQFNRNIPFSAFVQALRDLMGQLLSESDAALKQWKTKIIQALGKQGQVIIEVIPELEKIIGRQPTATELAGSAAQNRFNLLFGKFMRLFATKKHPLTIFLDDLQWADLASLSLLQLLVTASETGYLLVLGAYRDNEVYPAHPLILTLDEMEKQAANIHTLTLAPLGKSDITRLVADTLRCSTELATPLSELIYQKTQGNPFFSTQFLVGLHEDGYITFDPDALYWECDLTQVRELSLTDDVVEFMVKRLQKLPPDTQDLLAVAACIGNQFDLATLAIALDSPPEKVATDLWTGLQEGFVVPQNENYKFFQAAESESNSSEVLSVSYRFLHDRVQQAAYALIPETEKQKTHFIIGQLLLDNIPEAEQDENIFTLVNQLNYGVELIDRPEERERLARLNLVAGTKAKAATAYSTAFSYFSVGRKLLQDNCWQSQYELTLKLFESAAEAAYLKGEFETMDELIETVLQSTRSPLAQVKVYEVKLQAYAVRNQFVEAIETAFSVLKLLGVSFPESPTDADIQRTFADTKSQWNSLPIKQLKNLPVMSDLEKIATLRILSSITGAAYIALPQFLPFIVCEQVKLSIKYGNARWSAFSYSIYGTILCGVLDDIESGYQFGQLASQLLSKFDAPELTARVVINTDGDIRHWKQPARDTIKPLFSAYQIGLETGDIEFAAYCACYGSFNSYFAGTPLIELESDVAKYSQAFQKLQQETVFYWSEIHRQGILNLITPSGNPDMLVGEAYNEEESLPFHHSVNDLLALHMVYSHKLILNYLFDRAEKAVENAAIAETYLNGVTAMFVIPAFYLYDSLARLQLLNDRQDPQIDKQLEKVADNQAKMQNWAHHAPMNHLHKWQLVEAEKHRVFGNKTEAIELYDRAIAGAKENGYIQEEALANELAAKFYLDWGKEKIATVYMTDAYYGYARWGTQAKTDQLEAKYPQLLLSILQQQFESKPVDSSTFPTQTITAIKQTKSSTTSISDTLDFATLLQAAQALSDIIELNPLLADICRIILTNAGAEKVVLLIPQDDHWQLRAIAQLKKDGTLETNTRSQTLTADSPVPIRLIQYVKNTQKTGLINEGKTDISGILEGYLLEYQPQSVLCLPLVNQSNLVAILYLEHPSTKGLFTPARQRILQFLCTQAAIALKNAQLYEQAQQAFQDLQKAQLQLVQSEKMSALGNLMAGVAHEINNPIGFLKGNLQPAKEYVQDLFSLLEIYQKKLPDDREIQAKREEIDLEFIHQDLPELLESMNQGVERIKNISRSLRTFARKDQEKKTKFKLHEGIDSTLLILKHRTKANQHRPEIQIIKDYQDIPQVQCFPGQLNQVFMNILANAIDAFEEVNQGKTYEEIKQNPNRIKISISQLDETQVQIQIQDNACGMKPETQARIFEQGFTTKEVGKGTGLGMAIAHQIVTEKHQGQITVNSVPNEGTVFEITIPVKS